MTKLCEYCRATGYVCVQCRHFRPREGGLRAYHRWTCECGAEAPACRKCDGKGVVPVEPPPAGEARRP